MCGLFGGISRVLTQTEVSDIETLADLSKYRGMDATGIAVINRSKKGAKFSFAKETIPSTFFMASSAYRELMRKDNPAVIMGHCRASTLGAKTRENAHPIHKGHILGCHNGTISKYAKKDDPKSDSHKVFELIKDHGIDHFVQDCAWDGAYALTWFDTRTKTLNFINNGDRSLYYMWNREHTTIYWASDKRYLDFMDSESSQVFGVAIEFEKFRLYTLDYGSGKDLRFTTRDIQPKAKKPAWENYRYSSPYGDPAFHRDAWDDYASTHCTGCKKEWLKCVCQEEIKEEKTTHVPKFLLEGPKREKKDEKKTTVAFCKRCKKKFIGECDCPGSQAICYYPPAYDLDDDGNWAYGHSLDVDAGRSKPTSVPVIGADLKKYPGWVKEDTYIGYERTMIKPDKAATLLMNQGCDICQIVPEIEDDAHWYSHHNFFCSTCHDLDVAHDIRGRRPLWKGTLVKASEGNHGASGRG